MVNLDSNTKLSWKVKGWFEMTKWDKYLAIAILILGFVGIFYINSLTIGSNGKYILIKVNGEEYKKITVDNSLKNKEINIKTEFGYNKLEIIGDKIRVIESDCPNKYAIKQGFIEKPGQIIVCLPNKLSIEIKSEKENSDIDYISY